MAADQERDREVGIGFRGEMASVVDPDGVDVVSRDEGPGRSGTDRKAEGPVGKALD